MSTYSPKASEIDRAWVLIDAEGLVLGRLATELDVANAALYLASDEAAFLNGVSLPVDGGLTAC